MTARLAPRALAAALAALPCAALAQTAAEVEATWRAMVSDAESAQRAGDHARALDRAQAALRVHASPSLHEFIAREQSALGQPVAALASAHRCADLAAEGGAPRAADLARCNGLAATLERAVGRVTVSLDAASAATARVAVNGAELAPALLGAPYVVAAGRVVVEASAPGRVPFRAEAAVAAGATVTVTASLPEAAAALPARPPSASSPLRAAAIATAAVGGAALVGGLVAYLVGSGAADTFTTNGCLVNVDTGAPYPQANCADPFDAATTAQRLEVVGFALGGAALATSAVLWLLGGPPRGDGPARASLRCGPEGARPGISCGLRF